MNPFAWAATLGPRLGTWFIARTVRFFAELGVLALFRVGTWLSVFAWGVVAYVAILKLPAAAAAFLVLFWLWWTTRTARLKLRRRQLERKALAGMAETKRHVLELLVNDRRPRRARRERPIDHDSVEAMLDRIAHEAEAHVQGVVQDMDAPQPPPRRRSWRGRRLPDPAPVPEVGPVAPEGGADEEFRALTSAFNRLADAYQRRGR